MPDEFVKENNMLYLAEVNYQITYYMSDKHDNKVCPK